MSLTGFVPFESSYLTDAADEDAAARAEAAFDEAFALRQQTLKSSQEMKEIGGGGERASKQQPELVYAELEHMRNQIYETETLLFGWKDRYDEMLRCRSSVIVALMAFCALMAFLATAGPWIVYRSMNDESKCGVCSRNASEPLNASVEGWSRERVEGLQLQPVKPRSGVGEFQLEYAPGDPRLPSYQYPGCTLYCNVLQSPRKKLECRVRELLSCVQLMCGCVFRVSSGSTGGRRTSRACGQSMCEPHFRCRSARKLGIEYYDVAFERLFQRLGWHVYGAAGCKKHRGKESSQACTNSLMNSGCLLCPQLHFNNLTMMPNTRLVVCGWRLFVYENLIMYNNSYISCDGNNGPAGNHTILAKTSLSHHRAPRSMR
jgi:hypothetical protein